MLWHAPSIGWISHTMMKVVITGALGHIGSHLIRDLPPRLNCELVLIDNMMTQRYASLFSVPAGIRYRFIEGDITAIDLDPVIAGAGAVIHLAAMTDAAGSFDKADSLERNNLGSTTCVARACARQGVPMLLPSSTSVYGVQDVLVDEDCPPEDLKPQSPYARVKLAEEALLAELGATHGLRAVICRFGTIFGVSIGMRFHTAVNKFCWQAAVGQPVTIWRTAYDQKRPYLDLADAARAIAMIVQKDLFDGRVYNVVTLNATPRNIVDTIREFVPGVTITLVNSPIMNQLSYEVSSQRFCAHGFAFKGDLRRGIRETIELLRGGVAAKAEGARAAAG